MYAIIFQSVCILSYISLMICEGTPIMFAEVVRGQCITITKGEELTSQP